jgi:hypothetical protein
MFSMVVEQVSGRSPAHNIDYLDKTLTDKFPRFLQFNPPYYVFIYQRTAPSLLGRPMITIAYVQS